MNLLSIKNLSKKEILDLIEFCGKVKSKPEDYRSNLKGKSLAMLFEKPSTRTRVSFEVDITHLEGHAVYIDLSTTQLKRGETWEDTAKTLSRYVDAITARVYFHDTLKKLSVAEVPVINALLDLEHPCQILSDLYTIGEKNKLMEEIVYIGDGNNVCNSLILAADILELNLTVSCPRGAEPKFKVDIEYNPIDAIKNAGM